jgi:formate/nitrite transporter FocA (FNT family)
MTVADERATASATVVITFLLALAAGVLLAFLAFGYPGTTESADGPPPPAARLVRAIV